MDTKVDRNNNETIDSYFAIANIYSMNENRTKENRLGGRYGCEVDISATWDRVERGCAEVDQEIYRTVELARQSNLRPEGLPELLCRPVLARHQGLNTAVLCVAYPNTQASN